MAREGHKPTIRAICNEIQRCSHSPPPSSLLCLQGKRTVRPRIPKTAQKSLRGTRHHKPSEGHKLDQEKVKHELFALTYREVRDNCSSNTWLCVSDTNDNCFREKCNCHLFPPVLLPLFLLHFQSRQRQTQRKRIIITGITIKLV